MLLLAACLHLVLLAAPLLVLSGGRLAVFDGATTAFLMLATLFCLAEGACTKRPHDAPDRGAVVAQRPGLLGVRWTGTLVLVIFWTALLEHGVGDVSSPFLVQGIGVAVFLGGVSLRIAAIRRLDRFFVSETRVTDDQPLIRSGVYGYVRHPSETGLLAITLGAALLLGGLIAAAVWLALLVPTVVVRVGAEERCLRSAFGEAFAEYEAATSRLVPFVF